MNCHFSNNKCVYQKYVLFFVVIDIIKSEPNVRASSVYYTKNNPSHAPENNLINNYQYRYTKGFQNEIDTD